mmetsp:Transcript_32231/g.51914  ORF Transcript_32231/g.51914 Transcript_32231/m.51914 type:complete len:94 (-) Transcript_32231:60-341(-)
MSKLYKIIVTGDGYTLGNLISFFFNKRFSIYYSYATCYCNYKIPHPLKEEFILLIKILDNNAFENSTYKIWLYSELYILTILNKLLKLTVILN